MNKKSSRARFEANGGREGVALRILEVAKQIVERGSYKRAVAGAGQMKALFDLCKAAPATASNGTFPLCKSGLCHNMNLIRFHL